MEKKPTNNRAATVVSSRRRFLGRAGAGMGFALASWFEIPGAYADALTATPRMTEGPFYPDRLPLDRDNDLVIVGDSLTPASGVVTHLSGRILDASGRPLRDATIEIWQVDNFGSYLHSRGLNDRRDANFQGYGQFQTDSTGEYRFRTVKPVPYPGRTPHIHVRVSRRGREVLTTQCFIRGHALNSRDGLLSSLGSAQKRDAVLVDFKAVPGSATGELAAQFNIILESTPGT
jgi:protocatechuate 3,4-dioxygenase beta subunit